MSLPATVESRRMQLEQTLASLRQSLESWRVCSFEYEAFREELMALPEDVAGAVMVRFSRPTDRARTEFWIAGEGSRDGRRRRARAGDRRVAARRSDEGAGAAEGRR